MCFIVFHERRDFSVFLNTISFLLGYFLESKTKEEPF
jgi:hypothetical protein